MECCHLSLVTSAKVNVTFYVQAFDSLLVLADVPADDFEYSLQWNSSSAPSGIIWQDPSIQDTLPDPDIWFITYCRCPRVTTLYSSVNLNIWTSVCSRQMWESIHTDLRCLIDVLRSITASCERVSWVPVLYFLHWANLALFVRVHSHRKFIRRRLLRELFTK